MVISSTLKNWSGRICFPWCNFIKATGMSSQRAMQTSVFSILLFLLSCLRYVHTSIPTGPLETQNENRHIMVSTELNTTKGDTPALPKNQVSYWSWNHSNFLSPETDGYGNTLLRSPLLSEFVSPSSEKASMSLQAKFQRINCKVHSAPKG